MRIVRALHTNPSILVGIAMRLAARAIHAVLAARIVGIARLAGVRDAMRVVAARIGTIITDA